MGTTEETKVKIGVDNSELAAGMEKGAATTEAATSQMAASVQKMTAESTAAVKGMHAQMEASFTQMKTVMHSLGGVMAGVAMAMAGGAAFKEVIGETIGWTGEALKLGRQLGITSENASALMVAAHSLGITTEQVEGSIKGFVRQLKANEGGLNQMGIATLDAHGKTRNMLEVMMDANKVLLGYKEGKDRDIASMAVYGRAALENAKFLKFNAEVMEEAKRKQEELGIAVGPAAVAQFKAYKTAMIDVKEVFDAVKIQIGNALMPVLVSMGGWFGSQGPMLVEVFSGAIKGLTTFVMAAALGIEISFRMIWAGLQTLVTYALGAFKAIGQAAVGDFAGAAATMSGAWKEGGEITTEAFDKIEKSANKTGDALAKMWGLKPTKQSKMEHDDSGKQYNDDAKEKQPKAEVSRLPEWENFLEKKKIAENNFFQDSKEADLAYWEGKKQAANLTQAELFAIERKVFETKRSLAQEALQTELQHMKQESDNALAGSQARIQIAVNESNLIKSTYGEKSKEYAASLREIDKMTRENEADTVKRANMVLEQQRKLDEISIAMERDTINQKFALGEISREQQLQAEIILANKENQLSIAQKLMEANNLRTGTIEQQKALNDIEQMKRKHAQKIMQIDHQLVLEEKKQWDSLTKGITATFTGALQGMITGSMKFSQAMRSILSTVLNNFISNSAKMLTDTKAREAMMTTVTQAYTAIRTALSTAAATTTKTATTSAATTELSANAGVAASGAASSQASIPYVGPILAAIAAAAMLALVMGYSSSIGSAAGGWDMVPEDQMAMIHKDEMVLPADLADGVRQMAGKGDQRNQGGVTHNHNWNISAYDAKGVKNFFMDNKQHMANAATRQARDFGNRPKA